MANLPPWPYPRLCAHRGAGKLAPENTLTAMRVGHAHGYGMVEFDVKLSADNVSFLLHDATLERTTSGRGRADAMPWRELARLDAGGWHSAKYAGEMLPTFAAIARWARAHGVACNVEIKSMPGRERRQHLSGVLGRMPAAGIETRQFPPRKRIGATAAAGGALERGVVQEKRHVVGGELHVELHHAVAVRVPHPHRGERVLGRQLAGAAMRA